MPKKEQTKKYKIAPHRKQYAATTFEDLKPEELFISGHYMTDRMLEVFADQMVTYVANNAKCMSITEYYIARGVTKDVYCKWLKRSQYLNKRHHFCRELIGLRRENTMYEHDPKMLNHTTHLYSEEWDKANKDKAKLKLDNEDRRDIKVVFEDYRKKDD